MTMQCYRCLSSMFRLTSKGCDFCRNKIVYRQMHPSTRRKGIEYNTVRFADRVMHESEFAALQQEFPDTVTSGI